MSIKYKILIFLFFLALTLVSYLIYISKRVVFINDSNVVAVENEVMKDNNSGSSESELEMEEIIIQDKDLKTQDESGAQEDAKDKEKIIDDESEILNILFNVPFTPQAPFAEWKDPVHQDGCEEAAALMAVYWVRGQSLDPTQAKEKIVSASDYQSENYGEYRDTSAVDTADRIIKDYFGHERVEVKTGITIDDIIFELINGNIIILPMDGQTLNNPYYTPPGPERHNVVVRGYDEEKKEFITNDPGTRRGENYRYPEQVLYNAIRDYPSGFHVPIETVEKTMIIVKPE